jgi:hypothetical protein
MKLSFLLFVGFIFIARTVAAQELDAQVNLNITSLSDDDRQTFAAFKHDVEMYLNDNAWTTSFTGDRIHCSFQFNILSDNGGDYTAQIFVTSTRPLYKSEEVTTMARFLDANVDFTYYRGEQLQHGNNYRPLESVIDYYVNIILALDYDSYKMQSGTPYFQQAQELAVIANSAQGTGWDRNVTSMGTFSRMGYITDALDANNRVFRDLMFMYHYDGLDLLNSKPSDAMAGIGNALDSLVYLKHDNSAAGRSVFLRSFFEAKYPELCDLSRLFPDNLQIYFQKLAYLDPSHQTYYDDALTKATNK